MVQRRPLLTLFFLAALSCGGPGEGEVSQPSNVPGFYRLTVFLDSSLPKVPDRLVSGKSSLWQFSNYRNCALEWWRCLNPGSPAATLGKECLANARSWGSDTAWWNNIPPPRIPKGSSFQILFFNSSRDADLEGMVANVKLRFAPRAQPGRAIEGNPLGGAGDFVLSPFAAAYGGIDSQAWAAPSPSTYFDIENVGRHEISIRFEPEGDGPQFFLATVIDIVE